VTEAALRPTWEVWVSGPGSVVRAYRGEHRQCLKLMGRAEIVPW